MTTDTLAGPEAPAAFDPSTDQELHTWWTKTWGPDTVHERELFDYLKLELSPAYPGDELITIRLGDNADSERITYIPDTSIAV